MKFKIFTGLFILLINFQVSLAQQYTGEQGNLSEQEVTVNQFTTGTLTMPGDTVAAPLVIFIQGSGPTNRDGNQPMMKNDGIKKIAHELARKNIASYRYDKRIFNMDRLRLKENDLRFDDFVDDLNSIVDFFQNDGRFKSIILAGHSEGALIGTLATAEGVDALIILAGAGRSIDEVVVDQLSKQSEELSENARAAFEEIRTTGSTANYSPYLESIFRPSVQAYIASWMQYNPSKEIAKLNIPILIINGSFDLQVDVTDAEMLHQAAPGSKLVVLEKMNHIFRRIDGENLENTKAYNEPQRPLHPELIPVLVDFVKSIE